MPSDSHSNVAFYCPLHQVRFHTAAREVIECDRSHHALGTGFPGISPWTYCCDCATFSPYEPLTGNDKLRECLVCERQITKRYLCSNCQVISVESNALVRRKAHFINETAVQPNCPGCGSPAAAASLERNCDEIATSFFTSRSTCLFCDLQINSQTPETNVAPRMFCGGCGTELTAPFKFCKRCGKQRVPTEHVTAPPPIAEADVTDRALADSNDFNVADIPHLPANDATFDADDRAQPITSETIEISDTSADFSVTPSATSWEFTAAQVSPPRRTTWVVGGFVALLALTILIIAVSTGGNRQPAGKESLEQPKTTSRPTYPGMAYVPGGEFTMGSDTGDEYERPAHSVRVRAFYIDVNEVTCEDYLKFVTAKSHRLPPNWTKGSHPPGTGKQPVTGVDWFDATAYAEWAGKRLPTEEEWEFAARGTGGSRYPWGNDWRPNAANAGDSSVDRLIDVGSYPQGTTATGLMDLIGNAWEWTTSDVVAYPGGRFSSLPPDDTKIIRGGSWHQSKEQATTTYRGFLLKSGGKDYSATGFRCVKDADSAPIPFQTENAK